MRRQAADALAVLVGQPFWYIGRSADLVWLGFGSLRQTRRPLGGSSVLGKFALHLQCPWRISSPTEMLVGAGDLYTRGATAKARGWNWQEGPSLFDERIHARLAQSSQPLAIVRSIVTDRCGGFRLAMSRRLTLEVFPDCTDEDERTEAWRIFRPGSKAAHFVMGLHREA